VLAHEVGLGGQAERRCRGKGPEGVQRRLEREEDVAQGWYRCRGKGKGVRGHIHAGGAKDQCILCARRGGEARVSGGSRESQGDEHALGQQLPEVGRERGGRGCGCVAVGMSGERRPWVERGCDDCVHATNEKGSEKGLMAPDERASSQTPCTVPQGRGEGFKGDMEGRERGEGGAVYLRRDAAKEAVKALAAA